MTSLPPLPRLASDADKWSAGRVLVIGGSRGMSGAPRFASRGAWAAGVGLVTLAVPEGVRAECAAARMREMTAGIPETHAGTAAYPALRRLRTLAASADAVLLGPGAGRHPDTCALHRVLVRDLPVPTVVDADALFALADDMSVVRRAAAPRVLTPHRGEAARLLRTTPEAVAADPDAAATALAAVGNVVVVLKGPATRIARGSRCVVVDEGSNLLATGGAGDILAGLLAGLLAAGMEPFDAAVAAVAHHGAAATRLARDGGTFDAFPDALARDVAAARRSAP